MEQALKAGELSDKMINVLGKSRAEIDAIVAKAQVAAGGRNLQPLERTQAILRALGPDLQKRSAANSETSDDLTRSSFCKRSSVDLGKA